MPKYVIERKIPNAGALSAEELRDIARKSNEILSEMEGIQWVESYVTDDTIYCVYIARDEAAIREHARRGGFPADRITQVRNVINPATGE